MDRILALVLLLAGLAVSGGCAERSTAAPTPRVSVPQQRFDELLAKHPDLTYRQLLDETPRRNYLEHLSFDPAQVKFYDETVKRLQLTVAEREILRKHGFLLVDHDQRYSFGSLYYAVYTNDLPVLVTTDSILHAMHRTYDDLLMEMEETFFTVRSMRCWATVTTSLAARRLAGAARRRITRMSTFISRWLATC